MDGVARWGFPFEGIENSGVNPVHGGGDGIDHVSAFGEVGCDGSRECAASAMGAGDVNFRSGEVMGFSFMPEDV